MLSALPVVTEIASDAAFFSFESVFDGDDSTVWVGSARFDWLL
jgi:hypothetical protein